MCKYCGGKELAVESERIIQDGEWYHVHSDGGLVKCLIGEEFPDGVCFHGMPLELECLQCSKESLNAESEVKA